jgi:signal transduction histidine kinase/ligand-binding sensor domain-containing protein/DNA-binding response OmpR family regulator
MWRVVCFIGLVLTTISGLRAQLMNQDYKKLTTQDGLSHNFVLDIIQDKDGIIWIGTENGLNKYDGYNFTVYKTTDTKDSKSLPNNTIMALAQDSKGFIWLATDGGGISKFNPAKETFKQYTSETKSSPNASNFYYFYIFIDSKDRVWACHYDGLDLYNPELDIFENVMARFKNRKSDYGVNQIIEDKHRGLWLATNSKGLLLMDPENLTFKKSYTYDVENPNSLGANFVNGVFLDEKGLLWVVHGAEEKNTMYQINPVTDQIKKYDFTEQDFNDEFYGIITDAKNDIWMLLENGVRRFNRTKLKLETPDENSPLQGEAVFDIMIDDSNSTWLASGDGILYYSSKKKPFNFVPNIFQSKNQVTKSVDALWVSKDKSVWYSNSLFGIRKYNPVTGKIEKFPELQKFIRKISSTNGVYDILEDKKGRIWLTHYYGVICFNPKTGNFNNYAQKPLPDPDLIIGEYSALYEDSNGYIWAGTWDGWLFALDPETGMAKQKFCFFMNDKKRKIKKMPAGSVTTIYEDEKGNLYIGYHQGGLGVLNKGTNEIVKINYQPQNKQDSNALSVTSIHVSKDILWIGTGNGLFKKNLKTKKISFYGVKDGLPDNYISHILEDDQHNLWISTVIGISKFNPANNSFNNFESADGLMQSGFQIGSGFKDRETGLLYFGGADGFNFFDPKKIKNNPAIPIIAITRFKKHNAEGEFITMPGINNIKELTLPYNERDFTIQIAALDYTNTSKNKHAYWLEGYNKNWVEIGGRREITFTNLNPGSYRLKLKGSNNDGVWNEVGRTLKITILPAWWGSWWAILLYALVFVSMLYAIYHYRLTQLETIRLKELDSAKKTMYTNITHEFRTPLTVISGINKELKAKTDQKYAKQFDIIDRNSKNMLQLVNQLLELRKLEIGKSKTTYIQDDIISYLKYITGSFETFAKTKNIALYFVCISERLIMDYDPDKLLMIISNLLSNAIKYSNPDTDIYFQVDDFKSHLQIRVIDSGKGIPERDLDHIFDRFYKVQHEDKDNVDGVGIGLAVTKELVNVLEGEISVSSKLNKGSIFTLTLPIKNTAPFANAIKPEVAGMVDNLANDDTEDFDPPISKALPEDAMQLLVIEDNNDIIQYLKTCLSEKWYIKIARDGQKGIDKAIEHVPDVILCDLMMPKASGYEVLDALKSDARTSHVPIVILTAKADDASRLKAYGKGADAFLLKPFNKQELLIILKKLAEKRFMLQERFKIQDSLRYAEGIEIHKEDTFINKLEQLVLQDSSKNMYSITNLCEDLGMSRTQLHNKIKALTGKSTSIFVRSLRLQKGRYLLEHTNKSISEVAYEVGFNHPSYFSKSFTEEFGLSPSSLRK